MEEWKDYKIGDICSKVCSGGTPSSKHTEYYDGNIPWLNTKEINFNRIFCTEKCITEEGLNNSSAKWIEENSVIVAMYGATAGKTAIAKIPLTTNQACCNLTINHSVADYRFVYYYLSYKFIELASLANGGAQQNLNAQIIKDFEINLPSLHEQELIANVLSSLDDKIEVNRRINDNLEQQAQALFKSWFVDFEPFKGGEFVESELGMIPNGWNVGKLDDILELRRDNIRKEDKWDYPYLPIDIIPMHSLGIYDFKSNDEAQSSLQLFEKNDIVIGAMRVYFHRVVIAPQKGITRNTCFVLRPKNDNSLAFSVLLCNTEDAISFASRTSKGSTMPYSVWEGGFNTYKFPCPPYNVIADFDKLCKPYLEKIRDAYKEDVRLASLRDTLLPRLMSGEIKVGDVTL